MNVCVVYVCVCVCVFVCVSVCGCMRMCVRMSMSMNLRDIICSHMVGTAWIWYEDLLVLGGYVGGVRSLSGLVSLLPSFPLGLVFIDGIILDCYVCVSECRCVSGDEWLVVVGYP